MDREAPGRRAHPAAHAAVPESRRQVLESGPSITVAICTHDRPDVLGKAIESAMCATLSSVYAYL